MVDMSTNKHEEIEQRPPEDVINAALGRLIAVLREAGFQYEQLENLPVLRGVFQLDQTSLHSAVEWHYPIGLIELNLVYPFRVPEGRTEPLVEALTKTNLRLRPGRFELDVESRRLFYRAEHLEAAQPVSVDQLKLHHQLGLLICDGFFQAFHDICFRDANADVALANLRSIMAAASRPSVVETRTDED